MYGLNVAINICFGGRQDVVSVRNIGACDDSVADLQPGVPRIELTRSRLQGDMEISEILECIQKAELYDCGADRQREEAPGAGQ